MCCPAIRFALSVADVRLLCWDRVTDDTLGSQMSVMSRVNASACFARSWWLGAESQGGGAKILVTLLVECGNGVKRQRRSACNDCTTR